MIDLVLETIKSLGVLEILISVLIALVKIAIVVGVIMLHAAYATWAERKVIGRMQVRMGPTRVGPAGLLQPIADGIKLFFKEDLIPTNADKPVFYFAPVISVLSAMSCLAVLPFADNFIIADINIGILYIFAFSSIGAYGIVISGWASNSKYSFFGSMRSSAQVISYEVAMGMSLVGVMIMAGSLNLNEIVHAQMAYPAKVYIIPQAIGAFVFFIAALAETNRAPFDLPEAETELVAGYFTEYSGMRFSLFFVAEYIAMMVMALLGVVCFLGGWAGPLDLGPFNFIWMLGKLYLFFFVYYWVRATLPRYRYDQLMDLGWKFLLPLALFNIVLTATIKILA